MAKVDSIPPIIPLTNHPNVKDLTGMNFGSLTVLGFVGSTGQANWLCLCDCGNHTVVVGMRLSGGRTTSCGCLQRIGTHRERAGGRPSPELRAFQNAKSRCSNIKHASYRNYGGRGIEFRFQSVTDFLDSVGRKPSPEHSLDRINNDGHYEPGNVRWATKAEQQVNTRVAKYTGITVGRDTLTLREWSNRVGLADWVIRSRLRSGWCSECSVMTPKHGTPCQHKKENR